MVKRDPLLAPYARVGTGESVDDEEAREVSDAAQGD
jgi:hypothetical protein